MTTTAVRGSKEIGYALAIVFAALGSMTLIALLRASAVSSSEVAPTVANASMPLASEANALSGIIFAGSITEQDAAYLRDSLQLLYEHLPTWWQYVRDAWPLALAVDPEEGNHGRAAITRCCEAAGNYGVITFGLHFGEVTAADDSESQTVEARQITFLGVLVHEVTHVRDQRAGRFTTKSDRKACMAAESSGLTQQLQFKKDLAASRFITASESGKLYARVLSQQIRAETHDLHDRAFWDQYCGAFSS